MAVSARLTTFLEEAKARYTVTKHAVVYTAQEIAAAQHVPGRQLAKCVLVKTNRGPVLAVLPAVQRVDLKQLKALLGATTLSIARETDVKAAFPDVEVGAMSPFGNLYQVPVLMDRALADSEHIVFNAGSHTETITMRYRDAVELIKPKLGAFGHILGGPAAKRPAKGANKRTTSTATTAKKKPARAASKRRRH